MAISISLNTQNALFTAQKFVFALSSVLNAISLICLLKQTPAHQAVIRNYLICLQAMIIVFDVVFDAAVQPIPLFPISGGYCCGWLCTVGLLPTHIVAILAILVWNVVFGNALCVTYRHQAILFQSSPFKLSKLTMRCFNVLFLGFLYVPAILYALHPIDHFTVESVIDSNDLGWVRDRGLYHFERNGPITTAIGSTFAASANFAIVFGMILFGHMHFVLNREKSARSATSTKAIKRSLLALFVQLFVPTCMIGLSVTVMGIGIATHDLVPFKLCLAAFYLICAHSIAHNLILLSITREYRTFISDFIHCKKTSANGAKTSVQTVRSLSIR